MLTVEKNDPATTNSLPITESKSSTTTIAPTVNSPKPFIQIPNIIFNLALEDNAILIQLIIVYIVLDHLKEIIRTTNKNNCQIMSELLNKGICYSCGNFRNYHYGRSLSAADLWCKKTGACYRQMSPKDEKKKIKKKKIKKQLWT